MQVKRLDLGADVVYVPTRDILVIHPGLDYAESLGAVAGTLPHLHPDAVKALVDQVTTTPRPEPEKPSVASRLARAVAGTLVTALAVFAVGIEPATATAPFGEQFQASMLTLGFDCADDAVEDDEVWSCHDGVRAWPVRGFVKRDAAFYLLEKDDGAVCVLVFSNDATARKWAHRHPGKADDLNGRVVVWQTHDHQAHGATTRT